MSSREKGLGCEQSVAAAPYVLGALDSPDSFRVHFDGCATCRAEVAELQLVVDTLPATVPPVLAPRALRERVLATVRSEAELLWAAGHQMDEPPKPVSRWRSRRGPLLTASVALAASVAVAAVIVLNNVGSTAPERVTVAQVAPSIPGGHASLRLLAAARPHRRRHARPHQAHPGRQARGSSRQACRRLGRRQARNRRGRRQRSRPDRRRAPGR